MEAINDDFNTLLAALAVFFYLARKINRKRRVDAIQLGTQLRY